MAHPLHTYIHTYMYNTGLGIFICLWHNYWAYRNKARGLATVYKQFRHFKQGQQSLEDGPQRSWLQCTRGHPRQSQMNDWQSCELSHSPSLITVHDHLNIHHMWSPCAMQTYDVFAWEPCFISKEMIEKTGSCPGTVDMVSFTMKFSAACSIHNLNTEPHSWNCPHHNSVTLGGHRERPASVLPVAMITVERRYFKCGVQENGQSWQMLMRIEVQNFQTVPYIEFTTASFCSNRVISLFWYLSL
jgi:hypothetical protein